MGDNEPKTAPTTLPPLIQSAIEELGIDTLKEELIEALPQRKQSYLETLAKQVIGPITIGSAILGSASFAGSWALKSYQEEQIKLKQDYTEKTSIYQKYKEAHRLRWLHGNMLSSALNWGFTSDVVEKRKSDYDDAYIKTNQLYSFSAEYLDRVIAPESRYNEEVRLATIDKLKTLSAMDDTCLTGGYGIRNDWDQAKWADKLRERPEHNLFELKRERDCKVGNRLNQCKTNDGKVYARDTIKNRYDKCYKELFKQLDTAIANKTSENEGSFLRWKRNAYPAIEEACSMSNPNFINPNKPIDCDNLFPAPTPEVTAKQNNQ